MRLYAYKADLSNFHEITHAIGIQMTRYYNDVGKMSLTVPADDYSINALDQGGLLYDAGTGESYVIVNVKCDAEQNRINANAYTANWLLNKRAIAAAAAFTSVEDGVYGVIRDNLRGLPNVALAASQGLTEQNETALAEQQLLDGVMEALEAVELGHRMIWNPDTKTHTFEVYKGRDLTAGIHAVVFSEEQGTASKLIIMDDLTTLKNYFYLPYKNKAGTEGVYEYGAATAGERYEYFITAQQSQASDESNADFQDRLKWTCQKEASERIRRQTFNVSIDGDELGTIYDIGDKVACASVRFGMTFLARIKGAKYTLDANGATTTLILGEPQLTVLGEARLNG